MSSAQQLNKGTHSAIASCATFLFLPHFDVICDLLLNKRTATCNLFVKLTNFRDFDNFSPSKDWSLKSHTL